MNTTTINPPETATSNVTLQLKKFIRAKRERVFAAWTQPELMKRWFAPSPRTVADVGADLKVGGAYHVRMVGDTDSCCGADATVDAESGSDEGACAKDVTVRGRYTKIVANELVAFTWQWQMDPSSPETLVTVEFRDADGGTEVTLTHTRFAASDERDRHQHGWTGCLDNLSAYATESGGI